MLMMLTWATLPATAGQAQPQAGAQAGAQAEDKVEPEPIDPELLTLLADLASDDYDTRERATARLRASEEIDVARLRPLYAEAESPEQRHRLLDVARHHTIRQMRQRIFDRAGQRGSIGVNFDVLPAEALPRLEQPAIEIVRTMPGFPAYAHLRAGDLILAVNDRDLSPQNVSQAFQDAVQQHERGDEIKLTLDRDGERLERHVRLASRQALHSVYDPTTAGLRLRSPFREQWESARDDLRARGPAPEPLRVSLPEADDDAG